MPVIARAGQDWEMPAEGLHSAVCCDVVDNGMVETQWGIRHEVQLRWQLDETTSEAKPMLIARKFTLSLAEKSALKPFLETWRGKKFSATELEGFDLEQLINANCQLQVLYAEKDGRTYANVQAVFPLAKGAAKLAVSEYIRVIDREEQTASGAIRTQTGEIVEQEEIDPQEIPFDDVMDLDEAPAAGPPPASANTDYQAAFEGVATKLEFAKLLGTVNKLPAEDREAIVPHVKAARARLESA